jgi:hypothetical protein
MEDPLLFTLAVLAILGTPGPTNTLLATSGAGVGLRRSLVLLPAEACGYLISILLLGLVLGPVVAASPVEPEGAVAWWWAAAPPARPHAGCWPCAGRDVLLLEKEAHPRFHIGESLLPPTSTSSSAWACWRRCAASACTSRAPNSSRTARGAAAPSPSRTRSTGTAPMPGR